MLPFSYFTPIHKPRPKAKQGENSSINENSVKSFNDGSTANEISENEDDYGAYEVKGGLRSERDPIGANFDEGPTRLSSSKGLKTAFDSLRPPLLAPQPPTSGEAPVGQNPNASGMRHRHLAVLTAILHQSLLQHDYDRAAKAWSIMLRSELIGQSVDLRQGYRWGIGAEILLRQLKQPSQPNEISKYVSNGDLDAFTSSAGRLNNAQVEKLKEYYDRLGLQYPYHKNFPDATGPLSFRFALFGVWIYASTFATTGEANIHSAFDDLNHNSNGFAIQESLNNAREMSDEIAKLTSSPPYSDSEIFQRLKVMVDHWTADLVTARAATHFPSTTDLARP